MSNRKQKSSLLIESHPKDYVGYPFITLVQYQDQTLLTIVDNMDESKIMAYCLDFCGPERIDEQMIIAVAVEWFENHRDQYPISIHFAKHNLIEVAAKLYRFLNINFVTRFIGPANRYSVSQSQQVRRRKRKPFPKNHLVAAGTVSPADTDGSLSGDDLAGA